MRANKADMSNSRVTCITRFKNSSGVIIGYTIQNSVGQTVNMTTKVLRNSLDCGFAVKNLALTSDGRIIVTGDKSAVKDIVLDCVPAWTGKEALFASEMIKLWDEVDGHK